MFRPHRPNNHQITRRTYRLITPNRWIVQIIKFHIIISLQLPFSQVFAIWPRFEKKSRLPQILKHTQRKHGGLIRQISSLERKLNQMAFSRNGAFVLSWFLNAHVIFIGSLTTVSCGQMSSGRPILWIILNEQPKYASRILALQGYYI